MITILVIIFLLMLDEHWGLQTDALLFALAGLVSAIMELLWMISLAHPVNPKKGD